MAPNIIYCAPIPFNIVFHNANKGKMRINVLDLSRFCCAVGPFRLVFLSDLPFPSPPLPLPLFTVGRATSRASTRREGGREEQPSWKYSFPLSRAPRVFFFSKSLPPFPSSRLSPPSFLFFLFFFFLPLFLRCTEEEWYFGVSSSRCFEGGTMKFLIDGWWWLIEGEL